MNPRVSIAKTIAFYNFSCDKSKLKLYLKLWNWIENNF